MKFARGNRAGPTHFAVINRKSQRFDQVQLGARIGTESNNVPVFGGISGSTSTMFSIAVLAGPGPAMAHPLAR